ncbi:DUF5362 family protein [Paenibacillus polymyxa]|uniref:DUF5362 domain-containing protein n=1 Tax=Paenibacillus polymyxa (strain SC2) TaxID=886882 RepID=E3EJR4_PAEPS|nr:DUF5362 family protein [Paenibacillus polymyxa]ADO59662.2 hypothetical protein PPSC2_26810 [Paenibacillus polymyxa SC2]WPQ59511.1 DUF5362 family protein [Paenibacillus polymyxa]
MNQFNVTKHIRSLVFWCRFLGFVTIASGIISIFAGLVPFILPALLGVIPIVLGVFLLKAAKMASEFLQNSSEQSMESMLEYLAKYFKIQGIYTIVALSVCVFMFIVFGVFSILAGS